ncbi:MAG: hypothetical protein Q8S54_05775 [Bacteroidota bacterium]|nr:hypothetical protein [Odoribacter sp.]MDP3642686.1 hypothetical protein [Bacteroidota bacterium]
MKMLIAVLIALVIFAGCEKGDNENQKTDQVKITGKLSITKSARIDLKSATKVMLFNLSGEHTLADITNGTFSIQVNKDQPVGLIFTNEAKNFLGCLKLSEGIASLPLNYLNDTVSVVNLGELSTDGSVVSSSTNILTKFMNMSTDQIQGYRYANVNFSLLVQNPDTDRNGVIDLLEGKFLRLGFIYFGNGGNFNTTPTRLSSINVDSYRLMFYSSESSTPVGVTFSSLNGEINSYTADKKVLSYNTIFWSEVFPISTYLSGQCKVIYKDKPLYFDLPTFSGSLNNLIYVFPTLTYDSSNRLTKVSWKYYLGNSGKEVDATQILTDIMVQIEGATSRIYDSKNYGPEFTEDVLATPLPISSINTLNLAYNDIFGNHVVMFYRRQ